MPCFGKYLPTNKQKNKQTNKQLTPAHRAILYTVALAIASLLYLTVLAGYYRVLAIHGTTSIVTFLLGVAWAMALAAEALDPNNTFPSNIARMDESGMKGESGLNFRARVGLSGVTSFLLLVISLAGGLRVMGIWGKVPGWMQRDDSSLVEMAVPLPAYRLQEQQQEQQEEEQQQEEQQPQGRSPIMVALARVGIVKNRETVTVRGV